MTTWANSVYSSASELPLDEWRHVLEHSKDAAIYHQAGWLSALEEFIDGEPHHILVRQDGNAIGLLPGFRIDISNTPLKRLVSVNPGYGNPVLLADRGETFDFLLDSVEKNSSVSTVSHTLRSEHPNHIGLNPFLKERGYRLKLGAKFIINLDHDWGYIFDRMDKDRRYNIRKVTKSNTTVQEVELEKNIDQFYKDYCQKMAELGNDVWPKTFFERLASELDDNLLLLTVEADGDRRGYHLYLLDDLRSIIRHFLVTVTRDDFDYYSGEIMHKYAIKYALDNEYDRYDLGGNNPDFRTGGYKYKSQYGGRLVPTFRWEKEYSALFKIARSVTRRLL